MEKLHYESYDEKFERSHEKLDNWGDEIEAKVQAVKQELIMEEMLSNECSNQM